MIKQKICYIGFAPANSLDFLLGFNQICKENGISFYVVFLEIHNSIKNDKRLDDIDYIDIRDIFLQDYDFLEPSKFFSIFEANFYFIFGGYNKYTYPLRSYLKTNNIPHLISEYSGISEVFHFDIALNGEAKFSNTKNNKKLDNFTIKLDDIKDFVLPTHKFDFNDFDFDIFMKYDKSMLYLGMWDDEAGINGYIAKEINHKISPFFDSSYSACQKIVENLDDNTLLLIKPHPYDNDNNKKLFQQLACTKNNIVYIKEDINPLLLIDKVDLVA